MIRLLIAGLAKSPGRCLTNMVLIKLLSKQWENSQTTKNFVMRYVKSLRTWLRVKLQRKRKETSFTLSKDPKVAIQKF